MIHTGSHRRSLNQTRTDEELEPIGRSERAQGQREGVLTLRSLCEASLSPRLPPKAESDKQNFPRATAAMFHSIGRCRRRGWCSLSQSTGSGCLDTQRPNAANTHTHTRLRQVEVRL